MGAGTEAAVGVVEKAKGRLRAQARVWLEAAVSAPVVVSGGASASVNVRGCLRAGARLPERGCGSNGKRGWLGRLRVRVGTAASARRDGCRMRVGDGCEVRMETIAGRLRR